MEKKVEENPAHDYNFRISSHDLVKTTARHYFTRQTIYSILFSDELYVNYPELLAHYRVTLLKNEVVFRAFTSHITHM